MFVIHVYFLTNVPLICFQTKTDLRKERPLVRRKSELPHDPNTERALTDHHRHDAYLKSLPNAE